MWMEVVKPSSTGDAKTAVQFVGMTLMKGNAQLLCLKSQGRSKTAGQHNRCAAGRHEGGKRVGHH
ncbi:hypothetical protein [Geobacillus kaustophilus]|uniref:hypothetical protein n=1 Tax=Geobacillus kaustophilus TaxID=1462 RepID=UPI001E32D341|nr:hypothetical protein [Geobacillus kaustophilus]